MAYSVGLMGTTTILVMLTTAIGALSMSGFTKVTAWHLAMFSLIAAGMMSGCSFVILHEALDGGLRSAAGGFALGILAMKLLELVPCEEMEIGDVKLKGERARRVMLLFLSLLVHSAGEGLCLGTSAAAEDKPQVGYLVLASIALHNIPEGLATTMAFMSRGLPWRTSALLAVLSNMSQPLVSVATYFFVYGSHAVHLGLAFAAASMLFIVCTDLVPDAMEKKSVTNVMACGVLLASAAVIMCTDAIAHLWHER